MKLLAPREFAQYEPQEFHDYVRGLHIEPPKPAPKAEFSGRLNKKGSVVLTVRRKPKWLAPAELDSLAESLGMKKQAIWELARKRKIEIRMVNMLGKLP